MAEPLLRVESLTKHFPLGGGAMARPKAWVKAVEEVSLTVLKGESFGLVGESGCGKTTLGRLILRLLEPTSGRVFLGDRELTGLTPAELRPLRPRIQIVFQDPYSSLDPRLKVEAIVTEPLTTLRMTRAQRRERAATLLAKVGLREADLAKYPHEFSGGQRQRLCIARALAGSPELVVADEPVSALDVSIQAQVINLLLDLQAEFGLSYLFISHDLSVVAHVCDRVAVMYLGRIVELAPSAVFALGPRHPYTQALLASVPEPDPHRARPPAPLEGDVPNPIDPPPGCAFHPRCPHAFGLCRERRPELRAAGQNHEVACWLNDGQGLVAGGVTCASP